MKNYVASHVLTPMITTIKLLASAGFQRLSSKRARWLCAKLVDVEDVQVVIELNRILLSICQINQIFRKINPKNSFHFWLVSIVNLSLFPHVSLTIPSCIFDLP
eukprot:GHVR01103878.1.p1 GENE.GHVR01103878.1~~GHVR01103878.1.p1  ORF type:complete len:104 (+),score=4.16 GHVR01103878.1:198-509(+)